MRSNELVLLPTKLQPEGRPQNAPLSHCQARAQPHSAASPSHACCATGEAPASEVQPLPPLCTEPKALEVDEQHLRSLDNRELLREVLPATNIAAERGTSKASCSKLRRNSSCVKSSWVFPFCIFR